jgi:16S rRNA (cytosine1407-C5)-methyltransferase
MLPKHFSEVNFSADLLGKSEFSPYPTSVPNTFDTSAARKAFERYKDFTDLEALLDASSRPLRKSIRANTLKCSVDELKRWGVSKKWTMQDVPWCPEGIFVDRVDREEALGKDLLHLLGGFYMQEASSMLPVALLDPQPGDRVLDMSAAPGSKTTQIAARMQGRGVVIANDVQEKRIWSLISNVQRCGVTNDIVTRKVGQWFAGHMTEKFERVLCDAPCTAQGTVRKDSDALNYCSLDNIGKMANLQKELLEAAVHACRVGGRIVYSTCTLTPEENESVVMSILQKFPQLSVVDPRTIENGKLKMENAVENSIRVQEWMKHNSQFSIFNYPFLRLWPQTFDSEGFFSAVLQKNASTRERNKKDLEFHKWNVVPQSRAKNIAARLEDWYGAKFLRDDEVLLEWKEQLSVVPESFLRFALPVQPYNAGLPFGKSTTHGLTRLSHDMSTLRGTEAKKQIVTVSESAMRDMMAGKNIEVDQAGMDDGDVLLAVNLEPLGRSMVFGRGVLKKGVVINRLPRDMVRMFS